MQTDRILSPYLYQVSLENDGAEVDDEDNTDATATNSWLHSSIQLSQLYTLNDSHVGPSYKELLPIEKDELVLNITKYTDPSILSTI